MTQIQIDMFAVELGLSVLLQFEDEGSYIRVLADAGSKKYGVNKKLAHALVDSDERKLRIDLMIGTHYDGDHLNGLVDIIENPNIEIGEAWMPPVANDTLPKLLSSELQNESMLGIQFAAENGDQILDEYLTYKAQTCHSACQVEHKYDEFDGIDRPTGLAEKLRESAFPVMELNKGSESPDWEVFFQDHLDDAFRTLGAEKVGHADLDIRSPNEFDDHYELRNLRSYSPYLQKNGRLRFDHLRRKPYYSDGIEITDAKILANIRVSAAKDAINAKSLAKVVKALKKRNVKTRYATVNDGKPRKFLWDPVEHRFTSTPNSKAREPSFTLLGPSQGLVKKHWHNLPIGAYAAFLKSVPIQKITPSNELSYIGIFKHHKQRILVSGDAGCVDFMPSKNQPFHPKLIEQLSDLDIVQVAHHAGHNAHFYNCLLASGFVQQPRLAYLLLSHGTSDKFRPSEIFSRFVEKLGRDERKVQLLFTSTPQEPKVRDLKHLIGPIVGGKMPSGDIRLSYSHNAWGIDAHHIQVK